MVLKPQDTLLAIKYWSIKAQGQRLGVREIAESIKVSIGEISKSTRRLITAHLIVERDGEFNAEKSALLEWLTYGVRYAYPIENTGYGRGMPTSWNCPLVKTDVVPPKPPIAWSVSGGSVDGTLICPIHESVPFAASNDELLYEALSLMEAIRGGRPRELAIAREALSALVRNH